MTGLVGWIQESGVTIKEAEIMLMANSRELWQNMIAKSLDMAQR